MTKIIVNNQQRGQVLMLAAFIVAGLLFASLGVVRIALQAQEQLHVQHVADYAADAAGIIAARDLNFKAVTNRAMLANEVVMGQLMGLSSWLSMIHRTAENAAIITSWIPYIGATLHGISKGVKATEQALKKSLRPMITLQQGIINGLESAQFVFHHASWISTLLTVKDLIHQSDPEYELALLNHATLQSIDNVWLKLQTRQKGPQQHVEYVKMVADSRDGFSRERSYRWWSVALVKANKLGASEIGQRGGKVYWQAIDTTAIQARQKLKKIEVPVGWGGNYLDKTLPLRQPGMAFGGSYKVLPLTSRMAALTATFVTAGHQVPSQYVIQPNVKPATITLVVRKPARKEQNIPRLWAVGRTQLVYSRPVRWWPRADLATERANLFNALWRRQKAPVNALELEVIGLQV